MYGMKYFHVAEQSNRYYGETVNWKWCYLLINDNNSVAKLVSISKTNAFRAPSTIQFNLISAKSSVSKPYEWQRIKGLQFIYVYGVQISTGKSEIDKISFSVYVAKTLKLTHWQQEYWTDIRTDRIYIYSSTDDNINRKYISF